MFCQKCGTKNLENASVCIQCNEQLVMPQQAYYQPPYQQPQYVQKHPAESLATASMVCGIVGLFMAGLVLGIIAIALGSKAKKMGYAGGRATAGIVLGIIALASFVLLLLLFVGTFAWTSSMEISHILD